MASNVVSPAYRALELGLRRGVAALLLGFVLGCTDIDSPVAPTRPSSPTSEVTLSSSLANTAADDLRPCPAWPRLSYHSITCVTVAFPVPQDEPSTPGRGSDYDTMGDSS